MMNARRLINSNAVIVLFLLSASVFVFSAPPWTVLDHFEAPKRAVMSLIALFLLLWNYGQPQTRSLLLPGIATSLLFLWMTFGYHFGSIPELEIWVSWVLPFVMFFSGLSFPEDGRFTLQTGLALLGTVQAGIMLAQFLGFQPLPVQSDTATGAMIGTFGYHNHAASFLILCAGSTAFFSLGVKKGIFQRGLLLCSLFMATVSFLTGCRGAFIGLLGGCFLGISVFFIHHRKGKLTKQWCLAFLLILPVILLLSTPVLLRLLNGSILSPAYGFSSRWIMWKAAMNLFLENPFSGCGAGGFACNYMKQLGLLLPQDKTHLVLQSLVYAREPHNDLLFFLCEFGLTGVFFFFFLALIVLSRVVILYKQNQILSCSIFLFVTGYLFFHGLFSFPWHYPVSGPLAGLIIGIYLSSHVPANPVESDTHRQLRKAIYFVMVILACSTACTACLMAYNHRYFLDPESTEQGTALTPRMKSMQGTVDFFNGNVEMGLSSMQSAWEQGPDPLLANNLGAALTQCGRLDEATHVYEFWANTGLSHSQALHNVAVTLENSGHYTRADSIYNRLQTLWPETSGWITVRRIDMAMRTKQPNKVIELATPLLNSTGDSPTRLAQAEQLHVLNFAAAAFIQTGQHKKALQLLQSILKTDPGNTMAQRNLLYLKKNTTTN